MSYKALCNMCKKQEWCRLNFLIDEVIWFVATKCGEREAEMLDAIFRYITDKCPLFAPDTKKEGGESK